ncbi:hypothetical protein GCM10009609_17950 [Pseudonocardia aurantiaca]|uniref:Lanthionine synthetase LanC family protein n=1 Tax=Pseudonocardia aurantiaca TaxID=75290 RepID=A0ABW4FU86_9PSEU
MARALHLAGRALGDPEMSAVAVAALRGVFRRPWPHANLTGPTLCHGEAGLLQAVLRVTETDRDPVLLAAAGVLAGRILTGFDHQAPFGFRHGHRTRPGGLVGVDEPGLLQGAAGVALALATFARHPGTAGTSTWDSMLLLN